MAEPRAHLAQAARWLVLAVLGLLFLMPYIWMVSASLKPLDEIFRASLSLIPAGGGTLSNYARVLAEVPVGQYLWNGVVVCGGILAFQLLFAVPAGYAIAKLKFPGRDWLFGAVMLGLLVPYHVPALPLYVGFSALGLLPRLQPRRECRRQAQDQAPKDRQAHRRRLLIRHRAVHRYRHSDQVRQRLWGGRAWSRLIGYRSSGLPGGPRPRRA
jgi:hypothetical protein